MHERIVFLHVESMDQPRVPAPERLRVDCPHPGVWRVDLRFGFREEPDIPATLAEALGPDLPLEPMSTTYFVARSSVVDGPGRMNAWRCALFRWMLRQAEGAATYYRLPPNQVVELGVQVML